MPNGHPYKPNQSSPAPGGDTLGDLLDDAVQLGTGIGSSVLGSIADALEDVGDGLHRALAPNTGLTLDQYKRRLDRKLQNEKQRGALVVAVTGWVLAASFGIFALAVGTVALMGAVSELYAMLPLLLVFGPSAIGFGFMGHCGIKKYKYYGRLRKALRAARDWVCSVPELAHTTMLDRSTLRADLQKAASNGDLGNAVLGDDDRLYLDDALYRPEAPAAPQAAEEEPETLSDGERFDKESADFLAYLQACRGRLGAETDAELVQMRQICTAIFGFVHNHPEQLPRVRRLREYYLPTTRKLLDTAQGLGDAQGKNAQAIRRDITGILHTLNEAYAKLYDTLLQEINLDVSTEIDTLETMLRQDGLTHDFASDFKPKA